MCIFEVWLTCGIHSLHHKPFSVFWNRDCLHQLTTPPPWYCYIGIFYGGPHFLYRESDSECINGLFCSINHFPELDVYTEKPLKPSCSDIQGSLTEACMEFYGRCCLTFLSSPTVCIGMFLQLCVAAQTVLICSSAVLHVCCSSLLLPAESKQGWKTAGSLIYCRPRDSWTCKLSRRISLETNIYHKFWLDRQTCASYLAMQINLFSLKAVAVLYVVHMSFVN